MFTFQQMIVLKPEAFAFLFYLTRARAHDSSKESSWVINSITTRNEETLFRVK